jgi:hypothetical protein
MFGYPPKSTKSLTLPNAPQAKRLDALSSRPAPMELPTTGEDQPDHVHQHTHLQQFVWMLVASNVLSRHHLTQGLLKYQSMCLLCSGRDCTDEFINHDNFRLTAEGNPGSAKLSALQYVSWRCVEIVWCWYYSKQNCLKPEYMTYERMREDVSYFWIDVKYRSITVHYKRGSQLYKMCVSDHESEAVKRRGGFHTSNGHQAMFCFNQGSVCFVRCFDEECRSKCKAFLGRVLFTVPTQDCQRAHRAFNVF